MIELIMMILPVLIIGMMLTYAFCANKYDSYFPYFLTFGLQIVVIERLYHFILV